MPDRERFEPGTFSWADLSTTDPEAAKAFYGALFGWEAEDLPAGDGMTYTMLRLRGREAAAVSALMDDQREQGVPPHWQCYVTVDDADAAAARAAELGGQVLAGPFDVLDAGRMAVLRDPQGAILAAWQPRGSIGARVVNEHGALAWNDLLTPDVEASRAYYAGLFGWEISAEGMGDVDYRIITNGGRSNGGMMRLPPTGMPPAWTAYFAVDDIDAAVARVGELGGGVVAEPQEVPAGRFAVVRDPQGAVFSLVSGEMDD